MSNERPSAVLGALPRTRPHRRSQKRAAASAPSATGAAPVSRATPPTTDPPKQVASAPVPAPASAPRRQNRAGAGASDPPAGAVTQPDGAGWPHPRPLRQPSQPKGLPTTPRKPHPEQPGGADLLDTAVQAAAELTEIGLTVSARAIRRAVARLPRP